MCGSAGVGAVARRDGGLARGFPTAPVQHPCPLTRILTSTPFWLATATALSVTSRPCHCAMAHGWSRLYRSKGTSLEVHAEPQHLTLPSVPLRRQNPTNLGQIVHVQRLPICRFGVVDSPRSASRCSPCLVWVPQGPQRMPGLVYAPSCPTSPSHKTARLVESARNAILYAQILLF